MLARAFSIRLLIAAFIVAAIPTLLVGLITEAGVVLGIVFWGTFAVVWFLGITNEEFVPNCPHCGKKVKAGAAVCHHCGRNVR